MLRKPRGSSYCDRSSEYAIGPGTSAATRIYSNRLVRIENPKPLLADYPEYFEPIEEEAHY